jgi:uncharacterized OB-fold protein
MPAKRDQDFFWEGVDRGELLCQKCLGCGALRHPPLPRCGGCGSGAWEERRLSGRGVIHTWIVSRHPSQPDPTPRVVVLVDLEEGLRFVSNLVDAEAAEAGAPVELEFREVDGRRLPLFRKAQA